MSIHEMFPYIAVKNANAAVEFYTKVFEVKEKFRLVDPSGRVGHCELDFGCGILMLSEEFPDYGIAAPNPSAPASATIHLHVDNCDSIIERAVKEGAKLEVPATDHFYGERSGSFRDPFGHRWNVGHSIEAVSPEEMQKRYDQQK